MNKINQINYEDITSLALGAGILGSGGGGDPAFFQLIAQNLFDESKAIELISIADLQPDDLIVPIAYIGAPLVEQEKIPNGQEFLPTFDQIEKYFGKKPRAIMAAEIGGSNGLAPIIVAQKLGLPILDADGMGRAFPELPMCSFFMNNINATPTFITNNSGITLTITSTKSNPNIERIARDVTVSFGSSAFLAIYTMSGAQAKSAVIPGTISQAITLGKTIEAARNIGQDPIEILCKSTNATLLASGTIVDIEQKIDQGFLKGKVYIQSLTQLCTIDYQNEYLIAHVNNHIVATTPDIISIIETETGKPIMSESLRFGIQVSVIAIPAPTIWTTPQGLALVGPQYFGYKTTYKPCKGIAS